MLLQAQRAGGFTLAWRDHDVGNPDPEAVRVLHADRHLDEATIGTLTAAG